MRSEAEFIARVAPLIESEVWCPPLYPPDLVPRSTQVTIRVLRRLEDDDISTRNHWRQLIQAVCEAYVGDDGRVVP